MASKICRLLAGLAVFASMSLKGAPADACGLLSADAIKRATGEQVAGAKATAQRAGKARQSQCFYSMPTFANSVSVTLTSPTGLSRDGAREIWERWFHRGGDEDKDRAKPAAEEEEAVAKAAPVQGVGDEAYWVHSFVGNLYVRKGNQFLRISLGGKLSDLERQQRAKILAEDALKRMR